MNQESEKVTLWLVANKLSLNVRKTNFMIFKSKNKNVQHKVTVNIADQNINQVDHTKSWMKNCVGNFISIMFQ